MLVLPRNPFISSLLLSIVFLTLASAVTSSPLQNPTDLPNVTVDYSDYYPHQDVPVSVWSETLGTVTSSSPPPSTEPSVDYEDYYGGTPHRPPTHLNRMMLGVIVALAALVVVLVLTLLLWRFGTCRKTQTQTEMEGAEGCSKTDTDT
ncbi:uncharacterized protein LOC143496652 [Brachyhypopomus gauderio]|uniref:uncharacterized protein LOC143496652 n=1 Tax=Brachyhypopomus gauderio TaxID=698409 RepID=UPI00404352B2